MTFVHKKESQDCFSVTLDFTVAKDDFGELRANISALWTALGELQSEVRESFDQHAAMENHEHLVHHLGHEDTDHEIHHSQRHLEHLEQVHDKTIAGATPIEHHKPHTPEEKVDIFSFNQST